MKSALILVISPLFLIGVFADELKSVSVMEGDSITLHTDVTEIHEDDEIEWRLDGTRIAKITKEKNISLWISPDQKFRDRLIPNSQTGDLKIRNIKITDSGQYKLKITTTRWSSEKIFSVRVVISEVKSVSVMEGDSVTLNTDVNGLQRDDKIQWIHQNSLVAAINNNKVWRYKDRLELDRHTGSLTITNITTEHAGDYEVNVTISSSSSRYTIHKSFRVNVNELKSVSVMEGDSATLNSGLTEIQRDDVICWSFGKTIIAEIKADQPFSTYDGPNGRFRDRLKLDHQTGSLTITNTRTTDSGEYTLKSNSSSNRFIVHKRINVTVNETVNSVLVMEGDSVTLHSDASIPRNYTVLWFTKDVHITPLTGRWSNIAQNNQTEDLTIRNIRRDQSGDYKVIFMDIQTLFTRIHRKFHITITVVPRSGLSPVVPRSGLSPVVPRSGLSPAVPDSGLSPAVPDSSLSSGAETGIILLLVSVAVAAVAAAFYYRHKSSKAQSREVNGQNHTSNKDEETELTKTAEAVE